MMTRDLIDRYVTAALAEESAKAQLLGTSEHMPSLYITPDELADVAQALNTRPQSEGYAGLTMPYIVYSGVKFFTQSREVA